MALFTKVLFVLSLLCCTLCLSVYASGSAEIEQKSAELFAPGTINEYLAFQGANQGSKSITLSEIKLPLLLHFVVATKNALVAVAEAKYTKNSGDVQEKVDVVAKYIEVDQKKDWGNDVIEKSNYGVDNSFGHRK